LTLLPFYHPIYSSFQKLRSYFINLTPCEEGMTPSPFIPLPLGGEGGRKRKRG